ncbi:Aldo-keto reductase family 1 member B1-like 1 [Homarus americanus]|uniref:Aldo-keto reductase family 1 member B1-like 1 n=1 Tax=Homarus americanus TaxID=6706 RepID=A0A8J5JYI2_HOMAM|nr:Aldo-keto reductase family 1 member B1-like 1 [Homarus americanus]
MKTDLEAVWKGMEAQFLLMGSGARIQPANLQIEVQAYHMQKNLQEVCQKFGISVCAFGPLGAPYREVGTREFPPLLEHPIVNKIAQSHNRTTAQVLLRHWCNMTSLLFPSQLRQSVLCKISRIPEHPVAIPYTFLEI